MNKNFVERPHVITRDAARPLLDPYIPGLLDDFHLSWDWVQAILDQDPERRETFDSSTQAAMIFNRFVVMFGRRYGADESVELKKSGRMMRALIADKRLALRFKKLAEKEDGSLCAGNVKTNAQSLIYNQMTFEQMGATRPTEVTFGYTVDETNTTCTGIYLTCPISWYSNKWTMQIEGEDLEGTLPFAAPVDPNAPESGEAMVVITAKNKKQVEGA